MPTWFHLALLAACVAVGAGARLPLSPFPVPRAGLNATSSLFVVEQSGLSPADQLLAATLQGATSRSLPRVYRAPNALSPNTSSYALWLERTAALFHVALNTTYLHDLAGLVAHLAPELAGYVLANATDSSANTAVAACAALNAVAVTPANEASAIAAGLRLLYDVRGKDTAWALATFNGSGSAFHYSSNVTVIQDFAKAAAFMSDYSIAVGALQWWDADIASPLAKRIWGSMRPGYAALGWGPDEIKTVSAISATGGAMVASDW